MNYRPEIDGLRAIAVISVVLYHAQIYILGNNWFNGGFIGVDIFFVISGYLITRIILTELETTNRFSFSNFYERRARRILPMLLLIIAVSIPFAWHILLPIGLVDFSKSALSAISFSSNFYFYLSTTEYGAESALLKPLLHTWSLAVEEQFYLAAPIFIYFVWKFAHQSLLRILIVLFILSLLFAEMMNARNSQLNFFLPFSRFWELLFGSILVYLEKKYNRNKNTIAAQTLPLIGLFLLVGSILFFNSSTPHPSFLTLIPILGVGLIIVFCSNDYLAGRILSSKPFVGIGLISYSLYLWHFPIFAFNRVETLSPSNYDIIEWITLALILSIVTFYVIEKPFRNRKLINRKIFFSVISLVIIILTIVTLNFINNDGYRNRLPPILSNHEDLRSKYTTINKLCSRNVSGFCFIDNGESNTTIYAFGDSHVHLPFQVLVRILSKDFNFLNGTSNNCPFAVEIDMLDHQGNVDRECSAELQQRRYDSLSSKKSIVLLGGRFHSYLNENEHKSYANFRTQNGSTLDVQFKKTVNQLIDNGHQIILIYPVPEPGINVQQYIFNLIRGKNISEAEKAFRPYTTNFDEYLERTQKTFELFDSFNSQNIHRVYPHTLFCDTKQKEKCVTHDENHFFYADNNHLSSKGTEMLVELILEKIRKADNNIRGEN